MGKIPLFFVALLLFGVFRLHSVDFVGLAESPPVGGAAAVAAAVPPDEAAGGALQDPNEEAEQQDVGLWFEETAEADPYRPTLWAGVEELLADAEGARGWTTLCRLATAASGADRAAAPLPGVLACSDDPSVTELQQLAVAILRTQASTALWMRSAPGYSAATIAARQGEVRLLCATGDAGRGDDSSQATFAEICSQALDATWKTGGGPATFTAVKAAYANLATVIAERDATADAEPAFFHPEMAESDGTNVGGETVATEPEPAQGS